MIALARSADALSSLQKKRQSGVVMCGAREPELAHQGGSFQDLAQPIKGELFLL